MILSWVRILLSLYPMGPDFKRYCINFILWINSLFLFILSIVLMNKLHYLNLYKFFKYIKIFHFYVHVYHMIFFLYVHIIWCFILYKIYKLIIKHSYFTWSVYIFYIIFALNLLFYFYLVYYFIFQLCLSL